MSERAAFLFPGQGSQYVGMGRDLYEAFPEAREMFDQAEALLDFPLKKLCFEGPEEELKQTRFTQPAIFVHSLVVDRLVRQRGLVPEAVAGHSLGEYSALVSAGALGFADGLRLVKLRGELMQMSGEKHPGTMAAIIGLKPEEVEAVCRQAAEAGVVQPANFNCPGQIVISGSIPGVRRAMELARQAGARLVKELVVSGAFHSPLMKEALEGLVAALRQVPLQKPQVPLYSNVEAAPTSDPEHIRGLLEQQLLSPVRWEESMRRMIADGFGPFYELGPGNVLQGLLKRIDRKQTCRSIGTARDLQELAA
ncbi:MAG: [acyl-carrier-protein] S-malonyltransferase [Calditrichaeota bacterium]|nr:MAG: [acyl-carrier-protein] S-malonyltransferase [Calditrichota bacterium]